MSVYEWKEIVPETRILEATSISPSGKCYEYYIDVDYTIKENEILLLRLEMWDAFYVEKYSFIHVDTGEDFAPHGKNIGDNFRRAWIFKNPPKGQYKVNTEGGAHKYCVSFLTTNGKLPHLLRCKTNNSFLVTLRLPEIYERMPTAIAYRKLNTEEWKISVSDHPHKKIRIVLDADAAYEVKAKLFIKDLFESEYSPTITIADHQTFADSIEPADYYLFDAALTFQFSMKPWLNEINATLRIKFPDETEITVTHNIWNDYSGKLAVSFEDEVYDKLTKDTVVEWQLHIKDTRSFQEVVGKVHRFEFKKREKFLGMEHFSKTLVMRSQKYNSLLYLTRSGKFLLEREKIKGDFILKEFNGKKTIKLMPKYGISFEKINMDAYSGSIETSILFLPELLTKIFRMCDRPPHHFNKKYMQLMVLSLVCKYWFNTFTKVIYMEGQYSPIYGDYYKRNQLELHGWGVFQ